MDKPFSDACERNKHPILEVLNDIAAAGDTVLEIGAGTGQHAVHFATHLPVTWQPTDVADNLPGIRSWTRSAGLDNLREPVELNVSAGWPPGPFDGVFSANTAHIMGWPEVQQMFTGVVEILTNGGWFALYGPFNYDGQFTSEGNRNLDAWARSLNPQAGIRDFEAICELAGDNRLRLIEDYAMPANNRLLEFRTTGSGDF